VAPFLLSPQLKQIAQQDPFSLTTSRHPSKEGHVRVTQETVPSRHWHWSHGDTCDRKTSWFKYLWPSYSHPSKFSNKNFII